MPNRRKNAAMICVSWAAGGGSNEAFCFLDSKRRFTALCICMVVIVAGVFLRLIWLQVVQADRLKQLTKSQLTAEYIRGTPRGRIVDRDGEEMAVSIMTGSLYADPEMMQDEQDEKNKKPCSEMCDA